MKKLNEVLHIFGFKRIDKCKHEWTNNGFSGIECKKCGKIEYNPEMSGKILNVHLDALFQKRGLNDNERAKIKEMSS